MYHTLHALKVGSAVQTAGNMSHCQIEQLQSRELYIHRMYNVKTFYTTSPFTRENPLARMVNAVIRAINDPANIVLPKMICIFLETDFLKMMKYQDFGISMMIGHCLEWFFKQIMHIIDNRREDLKARWLGAVSHFEPKIIWVKMVEDREHRSSLSVLKEKFNAILEQVIHHAQEGFLINPIDKPMPRNMYDVPGSMSHDGRITYWQAFSAKIKNFNEQKEDDPEEIGPSDP